MTEARGGRTSASRRRRRWLAASFVLLWLVVLNVSLGAAWSQAAPPPPDPALHAGLSVESAPRWGRSPAGAWTPYVVTVRNGSPEEVDGEVVLTPSPVPGPGAPAEPFGPAPAVMALGGSDRSGPVDTSQYPETAPPVRPVWPSHRAPLTVAGGGASKTLTVLVLEAPYGYSAEVRDGKGRVVATESPAMTVAVRPVWTVAVLGPADPDGILRSSDRSGLVSQLGVTHLEGGQDLPEDALLLSGLQAILISGFDTGSLSDAQVRALRDFVGLGGVLVLGGGTSWAGTLRSLPDELVPLRPDGTASASLAPLAPVVEDPPPGPVRRPVLKARAIEAARAAAAAASASTATVATGGVRHGTTVLAQAGAPPLIVQSSYGSGHVVQLSYDPFAEPFTSNGALARLGLEAGVSRALELLGTGERRSGGSTGAADRLWSPVLEKPSSLQADWPAWPSWSVLVLGLYVLAVGPLAFVAVRPGAPLRGGRAPWAVPLAGLFVAAVIGAPYATRSGGLGQPEVRLDNVVTVHRLGADGAALVDTFHGMATRAGRPLTVDVPRGKVASTVIAQPDLPSSSVDYPSARAVAFAQPVAESILHRTVDVAPASGTPQVQARAGGASRLLTGPSRLGEIQPVQTLHIERDRRGLEGELQVVGSQRTKDARVVGRLTNRAAAPLRSVRTYIERGQALMAEVIQPGQTLAVDVAVTDYGPGQHTIENRLDIVLHAAASFHRPGPDQLAVVALAAPADDRPKHTVGAVTNLLVQMGTVPGPRGSAALASDDAAAAPQGPVTLSVG